MPPRVGPIPTAVVSVALLLRRHDSRPLSLTRHFCFIGPRRKRNPHLDEQQERSLPTGTRLNRLGCGRVVARERSRLPPAGAGPPSRLIAPPSTPLCGARIRWTTGTTSTWPIPGGIALVRCSASYDRAAERRRSVALARHFREEEGLSIAQIANRLGRAPATIEAHFYDPTGRMHERSRPGMSAWAAAAAPTPSRVNGKGYA